MGTEKETFELNWRDVQVLQEGNCTCPICEAFKLRVGEEDFQIQLIALKAGLIDRIELEVELEKRMRTDTKE